MNKWPFLIIQSNCKRFQVSENQKKVTFKNHKIRNTYWIIFNHAIEKHCSYMFNLSSILRSQNKKVCAFLEVIPWIYLTSQFAKRQFLVTTLFKAFSIAEITNKITLPKKSLQWHQHLKNVHLCRKKNLR